MKKFSLVIFVAFSLVVFVLGYFVGRQTTQLPDENQMVYATYKGGAIYGREVLEQIQDQLDQAQKNIYTLKKQKTLELIRQRTGSTPQPSPTVEVVVTKQDLDNYLQANKIIASNLRPGEIEGIKNNLKIQKFMAQQKQLPAPEPLIQADIRWKIPLPNAKAKSIKMNVGSVNPDGSGNVTIVEFTNFHCPGCLPAQKKLQQLKEKYKDQLKVYPRFLVQEPVDSIVFKTAEAALCANEQNKFKEFQERLFQNPPIDASSIFVAASDLKMDVPRLQDCVAKARFRSDLYRDNSDAAKAGIQTPPGLVVNGHAISGLATLEEISAYIDQAL